MTTRRTTDRGKPVLSVDWDKPALSVEWNKVVALPRRDDASSGVTKPDYVGMAQVAYEAEMSDEAWLRTILRAIRPVVDRGFGVFATQYSLVPKMGLTSAIAVFDGCSETLPMTMVEATALCGEDETLRFFSCSPIGFNSRYFDKTVPFRERPDVKLVHAKEGFEDLFFMRAPLLNGTGWAICAPVPSARAVSPRRVASLARVGAHIAAAARLRARKAELGDASISAAEGVLNSSGNILHLERSLQSAGSRRALLAAVEARTNALNRVRHSEPNEAIAIWRALVAGRWSLVEHAEKDGKRYLLVRRNNAQLPDPAGLSVIEQQVVGYAALGHSNKYIAYETGLAPSTVSQHLATGRRKLGMERASDLGRLFGRIDGETARSE